MDPESSRRDNCPADRYLPGFIKNASLTRIQNQADKTTAQQKMSNLKQLEVARQMAKKKLEVAVKELSKCIMNGKSKHVVNSAYESVKTNMTNFEHYHMQYAIIAKVDLDDVNMKSIHEAMISLTDNADISYEDFMDVLDKREEMAAINKAEEMKKSESTKRKTFLKRQMSVEWDAVEEQLKKYLAKVDKGKEIGVIALKSDLALLDKTFNEIWTSMDEFSLLCSEIEGAEIITDKINLSR